MKWEGQRVVCGALEVRRGCSHCAKVIIGNWKGGRRNTFVYWVEQFWRTRGIRVSVRASVCGDCGKLLYAIPL
jgi:hypothetical protein